MRIAPVRTANDVAKLICRLHCQMGLHGRYDCYRVLLTRTSDLYELYMSSLSTCASRQPAIQRRTADLPFEVWFGVWLGGWK